MKLRPRNVPFRLAGQSRLLRGVALLLVGFALVVGRNWCRLFCSDDCCAGDSNCPVCLFARADLTPADEPIRVVVRLSSPVAPPAILHSEPRSTGDYQLLPGRGPPALCSSLIVG